MTIQFTITSPTETRTYTRDYRSTTPEYMISDDAFAEAVKFLNAHDFSTFENVDYFYKKIEPMEEDISEEKGGYSHKNQLLSPEGALGNFN